MNKISLFSILLAGALITGCDKDDDYDYEKPGGGQNNVNVVKAAGDSAAIIGTINQFRNILGDSLNVAPGKLPVDAK